MIEELLAWADKHNVSYQVEEGAEVIQVYFESMTYNDATFSYNKKTGDYCWYGGD